MTVHATIRTVTGTVTKVSDGDTIQITTPDQTKLKVRLFGIDAPETPKINQRTGRINKPGQPYGEESWKALEIKIMRKQVKLDIINIDKYKRMVGASVSCFRRSGGMHTIETMNHFFFGNELIIAGRSICVARDKGEVEKDEEGVQTAQTLGQKIAWMMKKLYG